MTLAFNPPQKHTDLPRLSLSKKLIENSNWLLVSQITARYWVILFVETVQIELPSKTMTKPDYCVGLYDSQKDLIECRSYTLSYAIANDRYEEAIKSWHEYFCQCNNVLID